MAPNVKYRKHIDNIWRPKPENNSRLDKLRLDKNERISPFPKAFWQDVLGDITQELVQACPETWSLYKKLSEFHGIPTEHFLLTAGSETAIRHSVEAFVPPKGKVLYPDPTFAMVPIYCDLYSAQKVPIRYDSKLNLDLEYLENAIDKNTFLIIIANPNSPTGTYVSDLEMITIIEKAASYNIAVLIDEAYYGFCLKTAINFINEYKNLVIARSFSKVTGMAGLRIGYAIGHPDVIALMTKFRPMYEVSSIGVMFATKILDRWEIAEEYGRATIEGRHYLASSLRGLGFKVIDTETNFIHVDFGGMKNIILDGLTREGILVRGMLNIKGYENYLRFSVGPVNIMEKVENKIKSIILQYQKGKR